MDKNINILKEANDITNDNNRGYEPPHIGFQKIADLARILTGKDLTARDICFVFMAVKLQREAFSHRRDNLVDLAGYANLMQKLYDQEGVKG